MSIQTWFLSLLSLKVQTLLQLLFFVLLLLLVWLLLLMVVLLFQMLLLLLVMLVVSVFPFFFLRNADASSTDIDPFASGRSPQTSCICSGAFVSTSVSTKQNSPELRNIAHFQCSGRNPHTSEFLRLAQVVSGACVGGACASCATLCASSRLELSISGKCPLFLGV